MTTYNKAELAKDFGCSPRTIHNIARACGLNTKKSHYTQEEVDKYLRPARTLLKKGKTYKEVAKMFNARDTKKNVTPYTRVENPKNGAKKAETPIEDIIDLPQTDDFLDANKKGIALYVQTVVQKHVSEVIPYLPLMTRAALEKEYGKGNVDDIYTDLREHYMAGHNPRYILPEGDDWDDEYHDDEDWIETDAQEVGEEE